MFFAIVLAAGKSERMGRPKALLPFRGRTFLENILDAISRSSVERTVVVTGAHRREIEAFVVPPATAVFNPQYEQGMITSLQAGIRSLPREASGAVLFLVDHPVVDSDAIDALIAKAGRDRIVLPVFENRRGHPVFFGRGVLDEILALEAGQGANVVVRKDPGRVVLAPVESAGVLVDVDTPEDYQELQRTYAEV